MYMTSNGQKIQLTESPPIPGPSPSPSQQNKGIPWWVYLTIVLVVIFFILIAIRSGSWMFKND
jgi:hypothetical protein